MLISRAKCNTACTKSIRNLIVLNGTIQIMSNSLLAYRIIGDFAQERQYLHIE